MSMLPASGESAKQSSLLMQIASPHFSRSPSPVLSAEKVGNFGSGFLLNSMNNQDSSRHLKHQGSNEMLMQGRTAAGIGESESSNARLLPSLKQVKYSESKNDFLDAFQKEMQHRQSKGYSNGNVNNDYANNFLLNSQNGRVTLKAPFKKSSILGSRRLTQFDRTSQ